MEQLVARSATDVGAAGSRVLLTGTTYGAAVGDYGTYRPLRQGVFPLESQQTDLVDAWDDLTTVSGANRVLLTGTTYGVNHAVGFIRRLLCGRIEGGDFGTWLIDITSAIAWPLIAFQSHTHNVTDWTIDARSAIEWEPLAAGGAWDWPIDIRSSITWEPLRVAADWNIDIRAGITWELSTGARITDPGDGSAWRIDIDSMIEWQSIYGDGIDDWQIDMSSSLQWVTYTEVKDLLCVVSNEDAVSEVPAAPIVNSVY